jgi:formylglycine-generating enzyme required for sulfatase activity
VKGDNFEGRDPRYSWRNPGFPQRDDHPVVNITFDDATQIAAWLTKKEGVTYRLPTEAEWEYACLAGATTQFSTGDNQQSLINRANVFDLDAARYWPQWKDMALQTHDGFTFTAPVGTFAPNQFDLYDMHGNVWEWVSDWHANDYYKNSPINDPSGPVQGEVKVRRGGSWHTWPLYARCSYRNWNAATTRYTLLGVRLLREIP